MWTLLAFLSALCLGCYDVSKKIALRTNRVLDVLTISVCVSALLLCVPLLLSRVQPELMTATPFFVPRLDLQGHLYTILKSAIVLSSWVFAYISLKHLPISLVSPMQATRPMWTLVGALLIFDERLNPWQWTGVILAIGTVFVYSLTNAKLSTRSSNAQPSTLNRYHLFLALAILIGSCSGLYDKYLMRRYDHNAVQVYYTFYQALMMIVTWVIINRKKLKSSVAHLRSIQSIGVIVLISVSDNSYMLALRDPDSMIAVVSTIRRGGTVIGFAYGLLFLKESDPLRKFLCMLGICAGLLCLALGSV